MRFGDVFSKFHPSQSEELFRSVATVFWSVLLVVHTHTHTHVHIFMNKKCYSNNDISDAHHFINMIFFGSSSLL